MAEGGPRPGALARLAGAVPILVLARRNVSRTRARSLLAVVAVLIGIVAVGGIGLGGEAFKQNQLAAYEGFGGVATVSPIADPDDEAVGRTFTDRELDRLRRAAGGAAVTPVVRPRGAVVRTPAGEVLITAQVKGVDDPGQFYELRAGEFPAASDRAVVLGSRLAADEGLAVGDRITVVLNGTDARSVRVAGVLAAQGFSDPLNADRSVFLTTGSFDDPAYAEAIVRVDREERSLDAVTERIESAFNGRDRRVFVSQVRRQQERFEAFFERVNQFLIAVGGVSLLVAAVTIANTMLMSIGEREGELGLLRAVGYPRLAVLRLILAEAAIVGLIGALGGVPVALGIGAATNYLLLGDPLAFTATGLRYVAVGAALGVGIALLGGLYPAWTAAGRRPVEALD
jgi:putative ABC transport system permease protein